MLIISPFSIYGNIDEKNLSSKNIKSNFVDVDIIFSFSNPLHQSNLKSTRILFCLRIDISFSHSNFQEKLTWMEINCSQLLSFQSITLPHYNTSPPYIHLTHITRRCTDILFLPNCARGCFSCNLSPIDINDKGFIVSIILWKSLFNSSVQRHYSKPNIKSPWWLYSLAILPHIGSINIQSK